MQKIRVHNHESFYAIRSISYLYTVMFSLYKDKNHIKRSGNRDWIYNLKTVILNENKKNSGK